ncbi:MAG: cell division protein FtsB [Beggiatoa sp. IS2]|nr:MAG: cell division protein FtsB [Beggiatoa sp. IS2]
MKFIILIIGLLALLITLQYQLRFGEGSYQQLQERQQQLEKNQRIKLRNDSLAAEITDLKQGFSAIEERARKELGMIKEGEVYYHIVE